MSFYLSKLMVPIIIFIIVINLFLRFKIIKSYRVLAKKDIYVDPKLLLDRKKLESFIKANHPEHHNDIINFKKQLNILAILAAAGLLAILIIFLIVHSNT